MACSSCGQIIGHHKFCTRPQIHDLTDADRAAITAALLAYHNTDKGSRDEHIYRAGLAAGRARAIEECARVCDDRIHADKCAVAIRALLKD